MPTRKTTPARRTRQLKTPKQRAEETLAVAERKYVSLTEKVDAAREALATLEREEAAAKKRYDHACQQPDLQDEDDTPLPLDEPTDELTDEGET